MSRQERPRTPPRPYRSVWGLARAAIGGSNTGMSQFTPPPPPDLFPDDQYANARQPVPLSTAALVGFISSVVVCIPLLTQLLGFILGIAGIVSTSGGRARGRGLAIAATIISPLVGLAWAALIFVTVTMFFGAIALARQVQPVLEIEGADLPAVVAEVREATFSLRLKNQASEQDVLAFAKEVAGVHGRVASFEPRNPPWSQTPDGQGMVLHLTGDFANGPADVEITVGFAGFHPEIDNIQIGDLVLAPWQ